MSIIAYIPLVLFIWLPVSLYYWGLCKSLYWKRRKIPSIYAQPLIGSLAGMLTFKKSLPDLFYNFYFDKSTRNKAFVGIHMFHKPAIVIRDAELIKQVLIKDFASFSNRYGSGDGHHDILGNTNLFFLKSPAWKDLRSRMTPFFSSGKMKQMFHLMQNVGAELNETIESMNGKEKAKSFYVDVKDLCTRYTIDVIASCVFGVEANSLKFPDGDFVTNGKKIVEFKLYRALEMVGVVFFPEFVSLFRFKFFSKQAGKFLRESINYVMSEREKSGTVRQDLIDTLITLKNEDKGKVRSAKSDIAFQGDVLVAQAGLFFVAGFETSASTISMSLYELCWKPEIQKRLRAEIKEALIKSNGNLSYEDIQNMQYLNMVVQESMRMYPVLPFLERACNAENGYSLEPFDDFVIPKGMQIIVSIHALQRDAKHFPDPNQFDPERFSDRNKNNIKPYTFIPFGVGPRGCIGEQFGRMQVKIGLINIFKNHYVQPSMSTPKVMEFEVKTLGIQAKGGIMLDFTEDPLF